MTKTYNISVPNVLTVTWFNQDLQKLVCEVVSTDALSRVKFSSPTQRYTSGS